MRLTIEIEGVKELDRAFISTREALTDLRPIWPAVERKVKKIGEEHFKSEGAKGRSGAWKPLTRKYAAAKAKQYPGKTILRRTDRLYKAWTGETADSILVRDKDEFGMGTSLFYQPYVNKIRPIADFSVSDQTEIMKTAQVEILKEMKKNRAITRSLEIED